MDLKSSEIEKYTRVWENPLYRQKSHSLNLWHSYPEYFPVFKSALDIGCGLGVLFGLWNVIGYDAWGVDFVTNCLQKDVRADWAHKFSVQCLWEMEFDRRFDFGICTDVMEHIPPEMVSLTLNHIAGVCDEVLFKIAHYPSLNDLGGPPLHLTVEPSYWWISRMKEICGAVEELPFSSEQGKPDSVIRWKIS